MSSASYVSLAFAFPCRADRASTVTGIVLRLPAAQKLARLDSTGLLFGPLPVSRTPG